MPASVVGRATWARPPVAKRAAREALLRLAFVIERGRVGGVLEADEAPLLITRKFNERRARHTWQEGHIGARAAAEAREAVDAEQVLLRGARVGIGEQRSATATRAAAPAGSEAKTWRPSGPHSAGVVTPRGEQRLVRFAEAEAAGDPREDAVHRARVHQRPLTRTLQETRRQGAAGGGVQSEVPDLAVEAPGQAHAVRAPCATDAPDLKGLAIPAGLCYPGCQSD